MIGDKKAEAARTAARLEAAQRQVEEAMAELQSARAELAGAVVAPPDSNKPGVRQKLGRAGKVVGTTISRVIAIVALCVIAISVVVGPKVTPETSEQTAAREVRNKEEQAAREVRNREERLKSEALNLDILAEVYGTEYLKKSARDPKSLEIEDVTVYRYGSLLERSVCGVYNAKNGFGGYVGRTGFVIRIEFQDTSENPPMRIRLVTDAGAVSRYCKNPAP